jgi:HJR/Mrr/RecB family endonuclease
LVEVTLDFERLLNEVVLRSSTLFDLTPEQFEELIAEIWDRFGYRVELTARTRDGGRDVIAVKKAEVEAKYLIECKKYRPTNKVGVSLVRALFGVKVHDMATKAILATTSTFTRGAHEFLDQHRWELEGRDHDGIVQWASAATRFKRGSGGVLWVPEYDETADAVK